MKPTAAEIRDLFNCVDGNLLWRKRPKHTSKIIGAKAGCLKQGYVQVMVCKKHYQAHCLIWLHVTGEWPKGQIDHINRCRSDNRFENLRVADNSLNQANTGFTSRNRTGVKGVYKDRHDGKFIAGIRVRGKRHHLGRFHNITDAAQAYAVAAAREFGAFASLGLDRAGDNEQ